MHQNLGHGQQYKLYYLYGLERAGRLAGVRFFGQNDWYRLGAEELVRTAEQAVGVLERARRNRAGGDQPRLVVPGQGARTRLDQQAAPSSRRMTGTRTPTISATWSASSRTNGNTCLPGRLSIPSTADIQDMLQAPIVFFNGHSAPCLRPRASQEPPRLRRAGGLHLRRGLLRQATNSTAGFRQLMKDVFPEPEYQLRPLSPDHAVWRAKHLLSPEIHPLWGIEHGCRTVVIYSPTRSFLLLEPGRTEPDQPGGHQGVPGRRERDRLCHRPRDAGRQAHDPRGRGTARRTLCGAGPCESPSSSMPASGTSPRRRSPT